MLNCLLRFPEEQQNLRKLPFLQSFICHTYLAGMFVCPDHSMWLLDNYLLGKHREMANDFENWEKKSVKFGPCRKLIGNQRPVNDYFLLLVGSRKFESLEVPEEPWLAVISQLQPGDWLAPLIGMGVRDLTDLTILFFNRCKSFPHLSESDLPGQSISDQIIGSSGLFLF